MAKLLDRRSLLRGAGGAAVALPLLDAMTTLGGRLPGRAHAATNPKRLVLFFTGNGFTMTSWRPANVASFQLGPVLSPLERIKDQVLQVEGVPYNCVFDPESRGKSHPGGSVACFTGAYVGPGNMYNGTKESTGGPPLYPSIDHVAAQTLGKETKFASYHLGVMSQFGRAAIMHRCFYGPNQTIVNPNADPALVFEQLFTGVKPSTGGAPAAPDPELVRTRGVLSLVMEDYRSLKCRLGGDDRTKLERHLTSISELERRLGLGTTGTTATCTPPAAPARIDLNNFSNMQTVGPLQLELAAMALACDLTRVIGIQWHCADTENRGVYSWLGAGNDISHHDITHLRGSNPEAAKLSIGQYHAKQVLALVDKLTAATEGAGTVMDGTAIVWGTDIANDRGAHDNRNAGYTLIGRGGGAFKTGRYVKYAGGEAYSSNRLLLTVLQGLGVSATSVGVPKYSEGGPLTDLLA
jgi:hypothetical protein